MCVVTRPNRNLAKLTKMGAVYIYIVHRKLKTGTVEKNFKRAKVI